MGFLDSLAKWIGQFIFLALALIPPIVVLQILLSSITPFFDGVVPNLMATIRTFADGGIIGLIALAIVLWLFAGAQRRSG